MKENSDFSSLDAKNKVIDELSNISRSTIRTVSSKFEDDNYTSPNAQSIKEENNGEIHSPQINYSLKRNRSRICFATVFLAAIIFVIIDSITNKIIMKGLQYSMRWVKENPYTGTIVYTLICFVATVLFIPGLVITLGGAFIFSCAFTYGKGVAIATFSVFTGASLGALVSFLIGRYLLRDCVLKLAKKYSLLEAIDCALCTNGFRIMFLLRLSPIIPFNVLNYFAGVTSMTFFDNAISLIAILPGTALFVFLGGSAGKITETSQHMKQDINAVQKDTVTILTVTIGIFFAFLGIAATSFYARRELKKVLQQRAIEQEPTSNEFSFNDDIAPSVEDKKNIINISANGENNADQQILYSTQVTHSSFIEIAR